MVNCTYSKINRHNKHNWTIFESALSIIKQSYRRKKYYNNTFTMRFEIMGHGVVGLPRSLNTLDLKRFCLTNLDMPLKIRPRYLKDVKIDHLTNIFGTGSNDYEPLRIPGKREN